MIVQSESTLRLKSAPFSGTEEDLQNLIGCLEFELENSPISGVGLSAIQIGIPTQVGIIRTKHYDKKLKMDRVTKYDLYNVEILETKQSFIFEGEGCLSIPGRYEKTKRFNYIKIKNGDGKELTFSGFMAVVIQHELDHFDGKLFTDYLAE